MNPETLTPFLECAVVEHRLSVFEFNNEVWLECIHSVVIEIFDEYVPLVCVKCGYKAEIEYDLLLELFEFSDVDIPELECDHCEGGTLIPSQFLEEYKSKKKK